MRRSRALLRLCLLTLWCGAAAVLCPSCSKNDSPAGPGTGPDTHPYGTGTVAFDAGSAGGHFSAAGAYSPSTVFAGDTSSQGGGGFLHDTVSAGRPYQARLNAYTHRLAGGLLSERVVVVTLNNANAAGTLTTGDYAVVAADTARPGATANITFLFFSDSLAEYAAYEGTSGTVSITSLDAGARTVQGTFSGTFRGAAPDTSRHIAILGGTFDLTLAGRYYDY